MTIVVLLILAVIWAAVLIPPMLGARAEGRPADSIGDFRRQLSVLRRTAPTAVAPAHRLYTPATRPVAAAAVTPRSREAAKRRATIKRRRDVFFVLLASMGATLVLGAVPGLRMLWVLHLMLDVAFVAYVAMLIKVRNDAAERDMKLRFLPTPMAGVPEPVLALRRSAN